MKKLVEGLHNYDDNMDAVQMAELLWLSQFMHNGQEIGEVIVSTTTRLNFNEVFEPSTKGLVFAKEVNHTIVITKPNNKKTNYGFDKKNNSDFYATNIAKKEEFPKIEEQFRVLKIKQISVSKEEIDENKTAEYIASTDFFKPIFKEKKSKESYYTLHIVVDRSDSLFLWENLVNHFIKSMKYSTLFKKVQLFYLDSSGDEALFWQKHNKRRFSSDASIFYKDKSLTLVFSDVLGRAWKSDNMFEVLDKWSKYSFVTIVSMLPKRMWQKTPLRKGFGLFMKSSKYLPKNRDLKADFSFMNRTIKKKNSKVPVIPFDDVSFSYLSNILIDKKDSWIDTKIFRNIVTNKEPIVLKKREELSANQRVENFFSSVLPETWELALYCSILPLNKEIINEVIRIKELSSDIDVFSEFYFGGILDKEAKNILGDYQFYDGVRKELWKDISIEEAGLLFELMSSVISKSLGVGYGMLELLYLDDEDEHTLNEKEIALASLLIAILKEKGSFYKAKVDKLRIKQNTIQPKTNHFQMGSNDGDDEKPIHKVTFDYDFEISPTQVTFEEYDLYCADNKIDKPSDRRWGREKRPVINVSWHDAQSYCDWLNDKLKIKRDDEYRYRLPTEAEWEYACRAGTTTTWSFGDDETLLGDYAWYSKNSDNKTHEVGTKKLNPWGLHDMHGNVWEWCQDDWINSYEKTPKDGTAYEDKSSGSKVLRGGSWYSNSSRTRSAYRDGRSPADGSSDVGFRLLRTLP